MADQTLKDFYLRRKSALLLERESFLSHWKELSEFVSPRRGRFLSSDRNRGTKRHQKIINSRATHALRIASAGLFAGVMSPARPFFELEPWNEDVKEDQEAAMWTYRVTQMIRRIFEMSNLNNMAPTMLAELLLFATGAMAHVDDADQVARFYTYPVGSYCLGLNDRYEVNTFLREFEMTAEQMIGQFGLEKVSQPVKDAYTRGNYDLGFPVVYMLDDNPDAQPGARSPMKRPVRAAYFEPGGHKEQFLDQSGFHEFPIYAPRWQVTLGDVYGTDCPGMQALGDVHGLQIAERRKAQAVDKMVSPPLSGPSALKNVPVGNVPGGLTIYDTDRDNRLQAVYQVDPRIGELRLDMQAIEQRINEAFFVDLFMAISTMEGIQPKNQMELLHRDRERLLQLGPVLEQLHVGFLERMVDRTFNQLVRRKMLPDPPESLEGQPLRVRFVSALAMAQRSVEVTRLEHYVGFAAQVASIKPESVMVLDGDEVVRQYAQLTGVIPSVTNDAETVQAEREAAQAAAAEARELEQMQQGAQVAQQGAGAVRQLAQAEQAATAGTA